MPRVVGVFDEPLSGMDERHHDRRHVAAADEVVEHGGRRRVAQVVAAVVDHQQRMPRRPDIGESSREVDRCGRPPLQRGAVELELDEPPGGNGRVGHGPVGDHVTHRLAHRVHPERVGRDEAVERILDEVVAEAVDDLELVLQARSLGHGEVEQPPLAVIDRREAQVVREADAEVDEAHRDDRAVVGERAPPRRHDRERLAVPAAIVEGGRGERGVGSDSLDQQRFGHA